MATLIDTYQEQIKHNHYEQDEIQLQAIQKLQLILDALNTPRKKSLIQRLFHKNNAIIKGLYMWGGVGRGKTFIMDLFYQQLPITQKSRQHFNHFMKSVHQALKDNQGKNNPLHLVAKNIAAESTLICFDEFFVEDIADAMILGNLFSQLFELGVILVATSNIPPQRLYQEGLQRELFLPAIDSLIKHVDVFNLDKDIDYRKLDLATSSHYFYPLPQGTDQIEKLFKAHSSEHAIFDNHIILEDRKVSIRAIDEYMVWFDFFDICGDARGVSDYIALARRFTYIFVSNIPILTTAQDDATRRFIAMIDEFYDNERQVIISAEVSFDVLYRGSRLQFEFQRTISRLQEMQTKRYIQKEDAYS